MRYLITGGAGFIGSHLAEELVKRGHEVHVYDNLSTGRLANIEHLFSYDRFTNTIGDILDRSALENVLVGADQVVHLAAITDPGLMAEEPLQAFATNIRGTENVFDLALEHEKKVLFASSGEVYGLSRTERPTGSVTETDDWRSGQDISHEWAAVASRALDEYLALLYHQEEGLSIVVVRLFEIVGPRQRSQQNALMPRLVQQAIQGLPMVVPGNGEEVRYFTYVADATWAIRRLLQTPGADGNIYNVGTREETVVDDLVQRIQEMTGSSSEVIYQSEQARAGDVTDRPDISRLHHETGYEPTYSLEEILIEIITDQPAPWTIFSS